MYRHQLHKKCWWATKFWQAKILTKYGTDDLRNKPQIVNRGIFDFQNDLFGTANRICYQTGILNNALLPPREKHTKLTEALIVSSFIHEVFSQKPLQVRWPGRPSVWQVSSRGHMLSTCKNLWHGRVHTGVYDTHNSNHSSVSYTACPRKSHTLIFRWSAFCFDYRAHLLWHCFDNLMQCHNIYFYPELHYFLAKILY